MVGLRVGIIGCGRMGSIRAKAAKDANAHVKIVYDSDRKKAEQLASQQTGCKILSGIEDIVWSDIDAIFICTPPAFRGPLELAAIRANVSVFVEKPVGLSAEQALPILEELHCNPGVIIGAGYMNRYRESINVARTILKEQTAIGLSSFWIGKQYGVDWWREPELSGGPLNEQATHVVDLARYLVGEIVSVQCASESTDPRYGNDGFGAIFRFKNGTLGTFSYSCRATDKDIGLRIFTEKGSVSLSGWAFNLEPSIIVPTAVTVNSGKQNEVFWVETRSFLDAVSQRSPNIVRSSLDDAIKTQRVIDAMRLSSASGKPVEVTC